MTLALDGIKVIETATTVAGPMAGRLLAGWEPFALEAGLT